MKTPFCQSFSFLVHIVLVTDNFKYFCRDKLAYPPCNTAVLSTVYSYLVLSMYLGVDPPDPRCTASPAVGPPAGGEQHQTFLKPLTHLTHLTYVIPLSNLSRTSLKPLSTLSQTSHTSHRCYTSLKPGTADILLPVHTSVHKFVCQAYSIPFGFKNAVKLYNIFCYLFIYFHLDRPLGQAESWY